MNYFPVFLETENELNKILRKQKKTKEEIAILFTSLWDPASKELVHRITAPYVSESLPTLFIVDSFTMPHAFVIYKTTKLPHMVKLKKRGVESEDYLPNIYRALGI